MEKNNGEVSEKVQVEKRQVKISCSLRLLYLMLLVKFRNRCLIL